MFLWLIFIVVLLMCFGIAFYVIRSSEAEKALLRQLENIADSNQASPIAATILKEQRYSAVPWMHELLQGIPASVSLLNLISQSGVEWWVSSLILGSIGCAFAGAVLSTIWTDNLALVALAGVGSSALPFAYLFLRRYQRLQACDAQLPDAIELMARALRAGHSLTSALEIVSVDIGPPLGGEFRIVFEEQSFGLPLRDALENLMRRVPQNDLQFLTTAVLLQKETGGNLTQILDTTASVMRARKRMFGQVRIYTAQARVTGWVVSLLPLGLFFVMQALNPGYENQLLSDPLGRTFIYVGMFFWTVGILIIKKIVTIKI